MFQYFCLSIGGYLSDGKSGVRSGVGGGGTLVLGLGGGGGGGYPSPRSGEGGTLTYGSIPPPPRKKFGKKIIFFEKFFFWPTNVFLGTFFWHWKSAQKCIGSAHEVNPEAGGVVVHLLWSCRRTFL